MWVEMMRGMGRSTMSARHLSERLLSKRRNDITWHHTPSTVSLSLQPSGLRSMRFGETRSLVVVPLCAESSDQSKLRGGSPGRRIEWMSLVRSEPSSGTTSLRMPVSTLEAIERMRASMGTARSASWASTAKVM